MSQLFDHTFIDNKSPKTLVLLHGTGGTKSDFLFLDDSLHHRFSLLALQGNVLENGMSRFFQRKAVGVFDQKSIKEEAEKLFSFVSEWCIKHNTKVQDLIFLGYSNGANMILATLFYYPNLIYTAVLLHAMLPFTPDDILLKNHSLLITGGQQDHMVSAEDQAKLSEVLQKSEAILEIKRYPGGHEISKNEIHDVETFLVRF